MGRDFPIHQTTGFIAQACCTRSLTPARNWASGYVCCYVPALRVFGGLNPPIGPAGLGASLVSGSLRRPKLESCSESAAWPSVADGGSPPKRRVFRGCPQCSVSA